ncbi:MAG: caspase family protein [Bacteroidaceae bacterium]|nr:caspase family protein [Bacteroidaceae bacterium]
MKKQFFTLCTASLSMIAMAQSSGVSKIGSLNIQKEVKPAVINLVEGSVRFEDATANNAIDANETCYIFMKVRNDGKGEGLGCKVRLRMTGRTTGITYSDISLPSISVGAEKDVRIPVTAGMNTQDGQVNAIFYVEEPNGFGTDEIQMTINTKAFVSPMLKIVDYAVTGSNGSTLEKKKPFDLQLVLQNTQHGVAEDVIVNVKFPDNVFAIEGDDSKSYHTMKGGEAHSLDYQLIVNNNYTASTIPVEVSIREKHGKYAENRTINLQLNQALASTKIAVDEIAVQRDEIQIAQIGSDVDRNIPQVTIKNEHSFAVIIANENYQTVESVPYARNDGNVFAQYCRQTLGLPESNIHLVTDATLNNMRSQLDWIKEVSKAYNGNAKIILYYAGHGIPDEQTKSSYLLPVDGIGNNTSSAYKLDELYASLGNIQAKCVTVFLDACFSGSKRESGMLASARGVAIKAKAGSVSGNMVVFSAAQGDETAYPNKGEGHGMFTYYLLKKLQETNGDCTLGELSEYITTNVSQKSIVLNSKSQTPTVSAASGLSDWRNIKLK